MALTHFCLNRAVYLVILTVTTVQFSINVANTSSCKSSSNDRLNVVVVLNDTRISSVCKSAALLTSSDNINEEYGESYTTKEISDSVRKEKLIMTEKIKALLLEKLRRSEPSQIARFSDINSHIFRYLKNFFQPEYLKTANDVPIYDYIVLFPIVREPHPYSTVSRLGYFMTYRLHSDIVKDEIETAELWFYTNHSNKKMDIEIEQELSSHPRARRYVVKEALVKGKKWFKISVKSILLKWHLKKSYKVNIWCTQCDSPIISKYMVRGLYPFIVLKVGTYYSRVIIKKDEVNRISKSFDVCKQLITIDFKSLGWNKWIVFPEKFNTNYCRGFCTNDFHYRYCTNPRIKKTDKYTWDSPSTICCAPVKTSSLEIAYMMESHIAKYETLPDMIVEECGCSQKIHA